MRNLLLHALNVAKSNGVSYADVRFRETHNEKIYTQNDVLKTYICDEDIGVGIRVLVNGRWGFSASPKLTKAHLEKTVLKAIEIAKSTSIIDQTAIELTKLKPIVSKFETSYEIDPFTVPLTEKIALLYDVHSKMEKFPIIKKLNGMLMFRKMNQILLSTEGTDIENSFIASEGQYSATAVDKGEFQSRTFQTEPLSRGFEHINETPYLDSAERIAEEAIEKLKAPAGPHGKKDLIILPSQLALTIHESVGHPTELDRVLGWEANFAGTSFATPEKLGNFQYGSNIVNFQADNTLQHGLASIGFDDDGVPAQKWDVIKDGILVDYGTTRETANYIGQTESKGCNRADSYSSQPINRIPNLSLLPGKRSLSLDELIADTEDGLLFDGMDTFSIDQRRYNFQFGGNLVKEIKNGKITRTLKDVTYQSISPEFWNSCDAICDDRFWQKHGFFTCGKGEPVQRAQMTHGCSPSRFRNILVGGALNG